MKNRPYPLYERESLHDLKSIIRRSAIANPDGEAFCYEEGGKDVTITYKQFKEDIEALGTALYSLGLKGAFHIAILGENSYQWIVAAFAITNGSNVIVPIDRDMPSSIIKDLMLKADCKGLIYSDDYHGVVKQIKDSLGDTHFINIKQNYQDVLSFNNLAARGKELIALGDTEFINNEINNQALAAIFYTSGTTGINKGVMLTHRNIATNAIDSLKLMNFGNKSILLLPLHHSFGFTSGVVLMLYLQSCICINHSLRYISQDLKKYQPTHLLLVPLFIEAFYKGVWDTAKKTGKAKLLRLMVSISKTLLAIGIDLRHKLFASVLDSFGGNLNMIVSGGAFLDFKYVKDFRAMGIFISNGYGITECSPVVSVNRNYHFRDGTIGRLLPSCEMKIDTDNGYDEGEILVRGDYTMLGYYKDEQATNEVFKDGWFKTGDIGRIDKDGFIYITGRIKNIIILANGENIHPEEIESSLLDIPFIKEVIVREDTAKKGSRIVLVAEVFPDYDTAKTQEIDNLQTYFDRAIVTYNKSVSRNKCIQRVILRETEFMKTSTKKIKRI